MLVILVRHGETDFNKNGRIQGSLNIPLNLTGNKQAIDLLKYLCTLKIDKVVCSNLERAKQTIEPFLKRNPHIPCQYFPELQENCMGSLNGLTWKEIKLKLKQEKTRIDDYGENKTEFIRRVVGFWKMEILPMKNDISTVLVVTHGGYIATLVLQLYKQGLLHIPQNITISGPPENCSISIINVYHDSFYELISYSDNTYLFSEDNS
ncbi:hypothetical protein PORY_001061 [Pneumocystis oryctolagi]|uniref:Uncharacterized protein n=1 Tax=Pneumocystis oryctolagi TaxID=42067 RepID=A0ACB7CDN9_9ASCO|nr:hypothetical protein PORY_001061 [Pneumocystis oryctolagi]